jgi:hypothetical protein
MYPAGIGGSPPTSPSTTFYGSGDLHFTGELAGLAEPAGFARFLAERRSQDWVVYSKPRSPAPSRYGPISDVTPTG